MIEMRCTRPNCGAGITDKSVDVVLAWNKAHHETHADEAAAAALTCRPCRKDRHAACKRWIRGHYCRCCGNVLTDTPAGCSVPDCPRGGINRNPHAAHDTPPTQ